MAALVLTAASALVQAAAPTNLNQASITRWGLGDGLPEESIAAITESSDGYIWLATREGLVRFDGRNFRSFAPGEKSGLYDHGLGAVATDDHVLWAGGRDYVGYALADDFQSFTRLKFEATRFPRSPGDRYGVVNIRAVDGGWVLWRADGVYTLPARPTTHTVVPERILAPPAGEALLGFHQGRSGNRWIITASGLKRWSGSDWEAVRRTPGATSSMLEARDGSLWVYSESHVERISNAGVSRYRFPAAFVGAPLKGMMEDRDGAIWVGSLGHIARIRNGQVEHFALERHLKPDDLVQAIHQSRDGAIWLGTRTGNLLRIEAPVFETVGASHGIPANSVASVQQDRQGRVWIGARTAGVYVENQGSWRSVPGTSGRVHYALAALGDGRMMGVDSEGVWIGTEEGAKRIYHNPDLSLGSFRALSKDYGSHIYFSDFSGIYRLELPHARRIEKVSDTSSARSLYEGPDGLWAMSWERGLVHIADGAMTEYPLDSRRARRGMTLLPLNDRLFLVGTNNGVFAFDRMKREFIAKRVFQPSEQIFFMQPDDRGNLWYAGRRSLLSTSEEAITGYFEGTESSVVPTRLTASQGLASTNFGLGSSAVAMLAADGKLWLASQQGAIHFRPSAVIWAVVDVRCAVEQITADGTPIALDSGLRLPAGTRRVQIHYTVLGRKAGQNPTFRYRLSSDGGWVESPDFVASFTNLKPGEHRFELQARVGALHWPSSTTSLAFKVAPYWHERPWVRLGGSILVMLLIVGTLRMREKRVRSQTALLEERVQRRTAELAYARDEAERLRLHAEAGARAKSEFLANMSHEIRTPLNGVIGMTELALQSDLSPDQRELLNIAKVSADSLLAVINDILDFSKIEAGKMALSPHRFQLRRAAADTLKMIELAARAKEIRLALSVAPHVPDDLFGDLGRLRQILLNLLSNAVKFTHEGSVTLGITCEHASPAEVILHFTVADTGIGVPVELCDRIFRPFEQGDGSITRRYGGTGLGLAISSRLVQLMNGHIWVESEVGRGSTFHFTVQFAPANQQAAASEAAPSVELAALHPHTHARILLAEDNAVNEFVAVRLLQREGYHVTVARTGLEALEQWERSYFDLLLLDVQMPGMDGLEAAAEIRRREGPDTRVPILALTAGAFPEDRARCSAAGMDDFIAKPIVPADLFAALQRWLAAEPGAPVLSSAARPC